MLTAKMTSADKVKPDAPEPDRTIPPDLDPAPEPMAYAVLMGPRAQLTAGQVVFAPAGEIAALIAAGAGRQPTVGELDRAHPFHFMLPPADTPAAVEPASEA